MTDIKTVGFIGAGGVNSRFARLSANAGFKVLISNSRGPESLRDVISELGPRAKAVSIDQVNTADLLVYSVPFGNLDKVPAKPFVGKTIIDTTNYYAARDGNISDLDNRELTSSEYVQRHFEDAHVVKALHNMDLFHIDNGGDQKRQAEPWAVPMAGDNNEAKKQVSKFIKAIGFEAVDCGSLKESWKIEANTPVYLWPYVGKIPDGLDKEEAMYWYKQDKSATVTRQDLVRLVEQAAKDIPVGGHLESAPKPWMDWILYWMNGSQ